MNWTPIIIIRALPPFIRFHFFQPGLSLSLSSLESWRSRFPPHKAFVLSLALPSRSPQLVSPPPQRAPPSSFFAPPSAPCTTIFERGPRDRTTRSRRPPPPRASERARERERGRDRGRSLCFFLAQKSRRQAEEEGEEEEPFWRNFTQFCCCRRLLFTHASLSRPPHALR